MSLKERFFSTDSGELPDGAGDGTRTKGVIFLETKEGEIIELLEQTNRRLSSVEDRLKEVKESANSARRRTKNRLKELKKKLGKRHSRTFNSLQEVRSATEHLRIELKELNERSEDRDKLVETLRKRNRQLRKEFLFDNLIGDGAGKLISMRDAVRERRNHCGGGREEFLSQLEGRLLEALEEFEVREVSADGAEFDPSCQEVVKKVPVDSPRKADSVLEVVEEGYRWEETVIRPQRVVVGKLSHGGEDHDR